MNSKTYNASLEDGRSDSSDMGVVSKFATSWVKPHFIEWRDVNVVFGKSQLLRQYVHEFVRIFELYFPGLLSEDEFERYICTLTIMRIRRATFQQYPFDLRTHRMFIPSFWCLYLDQIGIVEDDALGVRLVPAIGADLAESELSESDFRLISEKLLKAQSTFKYGNELPRSTKGNFDFMTMQCVNGELVSHQPDVHPSLALMSGFMEQKMVEQIFFPLVSYGSTKSMLSQVGGLV